MGTVPHRSPGRCRSRRRTLSSVACSRRLSRSTTGCTCHQLSACTTRLIGAIPGRPTWPSDGRAGRPTRRAASTVARRSPWARPASSLARVPVSGSRPVGMVVIDPPGRRRHVAARLVERSLGIDLLKERSHQRLVVVDEDRPALADLIGQATHPGGDHRAGNQLGSFDDTGRPDLAVGKHDRVGGHEPTVELDVSHEALVELGPRGRRGQPTEATDMGNHIGVIDARRAHHVERRQTGRQLSERLDGPIEALVSLKEPDRHEDVSGRIQPQFGSCGLLVAPVAKRERLPVVDQREAGGVETERLDQPVAFGGGVQRHRPRRPDGRRRRPTFDRVDVERRVVDLVDPQLQVGPAPEDGEETPLTGAVATPFGSRSSAVRGRTGRSPDRTIERVPTADQDPSGRRPRGDTGPPRAPVSTRRPRCPPTAAGPLPVRRRWRSRLDRAGTAKP